ncbi:MAG: hypothetical protein NW237_05495 [Cyanobacteriota bacterium]|nr:hypothetical protein [Cyanobacteriota bacterium]
MKLRPLLSKTLKYLSVSIIAQAISFICGILIIRILTKDDYALLTIANSIQGALGVLTGSGVGSALTSIGGKIWFNHSRFSELIVTALKTRYLFALIVGLAGFPILVLLLEKVSDNLISNTTLAIVIFAEFGFYLNSGIFVVVPRLYGQAVEVKKNELYSSILRLISLLIFSPLGLSSHLAALASLIGSGANTFGLYKWVREKVDFSAPMNSNDRDEIYKLTIAQLPNSLFYAFQGQIIIWLVTAFGKPENIAEIGALSRLSLVLNIISQFLADIILPKFAKLQSYKKLGIAYFALIAAFSAIALIFIFLAGMYPKELLWILGEKYSTANEIFVLIVAKTMINTILGVTWQVNVTRGWVKRIWISIPMILSVQLGLVTILDFSKVANVIIFSIISILPAFVVNISLTLIGLRNMRIEQVKSEM